MGLMLGVELVRDRRSKEPATAETADVLELCKERGLLIGKGGLAGNALRIKPPMCLTRDDADFLVDCLDEVLTEVSARGEESIRPGEPRWPSMVSRACGRDTIGGWRSPAASTAVRRETGPPGLCEPSREQEGPR